MPFPPTDDQRRAIEAPPGPTLVVAGPGAGKTFCLIERVRFLLSRHGFAPERILALTFTNKAAGEVAHRLVEHGGEAGGLVDRRTLHAWCLRLLREFPEAAGLRPGFGVADDDYQLGLLRLLRVPDRFARHLVTEFGRARHRGGALPARDQRIYAAYRDLLRRRNLLDFDDLILLAHELLRAREEVRADVAGRWDAVLVDEFQDLTLTQYQIVTCLAERHRHLFAVGDDEQSIYGFAGADPRILDRFQRDFGIAEPVMLGTNHRNSRVIFETARRLLRHNRPLFAKQLAAIRESPFPVQALRFRTEEEETAWLIRDLKDDRAAAELQWGDAAVLYRRHQLGERLETSLLRAGIPVVAGRGRAIAEDPVAGPVFAALRAIQDPKDRVPWEILTKRFLPAELRETVRAKHPGRPLSTALRLYGWAKDTPEIEGRKVRRLYYHLTNLPALARASGTIGELVEALLEQRPSDRRTPLEESADDLSDPESLPAARELSDALERARDEGLRIHLVPGGGLEIALQGMLRAAGLGHLVAREGAEPDPGDVILDLRATPGAAVRVFKALQRLAAVGRGLRLDDCVTFDLETTGTDIAGCGIVEIGAARIQGGRVTDTFRSLVHPGMPIPAEATGAHGYTDADVEGAPPFGEVWPPFREFVGSDLLVGHNAREFDLPVLIRHVRSVGGDTAGLACFDTLPLARAVGRGSATLATLATRYGAPLPRAHHALDDAVALAGVVRGLLNDRVAFHRKTSFVAGLDWLGLALALERGEPSDEERRLLEIARVYTLGPYSECLAEYAEARAAARPDLPPVEAVIERLGGTAVMQRLRARRTAADRYPSSVARLRRLVADFASLPVEDGIREVLDRVALAQRAGADTDRAAVSLLTLHATKGLEFSRVYIVGVEDYEIPGFHAMQGRGDDEFPESRRLLYVGMTRARDRLVLTSAVERARRGTGGTMLFGETGLTWQAGAAAVPGPRREPELLVHPRPAKDQTGA